MSIHPRHAQTLTVLLLTGVMTFVVSGISTLLALGASGGMLARWPTAWVTSWVIAFPTMLVALPLVRRIVSRLCAPEPPR